ncbi:MAG TPA: hypothetical protein VND45_00330 [Thermoanaerobaculia bacterium]|nr:hypothetical protein [Thermoanaerobaculia bacterium]
MRRPIVSFLLLVLAACTTAKRPLVHERYDDPDAAAAYRALQQQGSDDPVRSLREAREQMRFMNVYSSVEDRVVQSSSGHGDETRLEDSARQLGKWKFLGPGNIGGRTRVLVIDPAEPRVMYSGGVSGGLWKTTTAGAEWFPIGDDLANIAINSLVMHPTDRNTLYAGTGEGYFRELQRGTALPLRGDGIFVTHDGGDTWTRLSSTDRDDFHYVNDLAISTHDPSRVYAATRTGVWRSNDAGTSWNRVLATTVMGGCLDLAYRADTAGDYLFASCGTFEQATVYRNKSAESDGAWESVLSEPFMGRTTLAIAPSNPSIVYALSASNEPGIFNQGLLAVFRSNADGNAGSWTARVRNTDPTFASMMLTNLIVAYGDVCSNTGTGYTTMGWYCNTIAVDPKDPNRVWTAGVDLFRSDDGGLTWGVASYWWASQGGHRSFVHADQHAIVFDPRYDGAANRMAYFANDGGIYRTDDARAAVARDEVAMCNPDKSKMVFTKLSNSYGVTQFYHGAVSPDGHTFIAGAQDNGTLMGHIDRGPNDWWEVRGGDGGYVVIDPTNPDIIYAESQNANLSRSTNGGLGWKSIRSGLANQPFLFVTPYTLDPNNPTRLWLGGKVMWRTNNRGENWSPGSAPLPALVSAVAVQHGTGQVVLGGTALGHIARTDHSFTSTETTQWDLVQPRQGFVSWIAFDPVNRDTVYATYAGFGGTHVWMSSDAGRTWTPRDGNLPDMPVHSLAVDPTRPERLYLGTDLGVFVSIDQGLTWNVENTGFANVVTETVLVGQGTAGLAVYAFTHGRGAWKAELTFQSKAKRRAVR